MISTATDAVAAAIQSNLQQFSEAAHRIADPDTAAGVADIVQMKSAEHAVRVNTAVLKMANEMSGHLIDLLV